MKAGAMGGGGGIPNPSNAPSGPAAPHNAKNREKENTPLVIFPNEINGRPPTNRR